ncbi:MAG: PilZ domain-containing protein [Lachnospiraceae bacterium]|nr:PilZ domain-containing protein [Lachnospiraceae bacterium]
MKLAEIAEGSNLTLIIHNDTKRMRMGAVLKKHVKENVALITIEYGQGKRLIFDNVSISMEYEGDKDVPIIWNNVKITNYQSAYVMVVSGEGVRNNRRNSFRVGVSKLARVKSMNGPGQVMIRDVSMSGFSITDKSSSIGLKIGDELSVFLDDMGHELDLRGRVVRIEEKDDGLKIYGFEICNMCKDLSAYVTLKQRRVREQKKENAKRVRRA